ncbi:DUF1430 domain-containing protein [Bacillus toyonensis]|uniref:DUF1430 domain-containing protein n=1 Tax=Bacillus thuringiensis TaxID=1428 RepID=UPI001BD17486|nr:DUF1430 domain-containing protein [Bacillus toyonensis]
MKKLLFFLYILIFSFSFFVFTDWISNKQEESMRLAGKEESFIFTINENVLKTDSKNFLLLLRIASDEYEANIFKSIYSEDSSTEYIYLTHDIKSYFSNFSLLNGILPNNNKENDFYLSTLQNKEITGKIFSYKKDINFNIRPLKSYPMDKSIGGKYIVSLKDQTKIHSFINRLQNDFGIPIKYSIYEIQPTIELFWLKIIPIILLYILSLLIIIYYYFLEYKNSAVRLLHGYGPIDIWKKYFYEICRLYFSAAIISTIFMLFISAGTSLSTPYWFEVIINYFLYQFIAGIIFCFILSALFIRVGKIPIAISIKNKKPLKQIQFVNGFAKVIFSIVILCLLFISFLTFFDSYRYYYKNANDWKQLKSYGTMSTKAPLPSQNDARGTLQIFDKKYQLFKYTNDRGAILIHFSDAYMIEQTGGKSRNKSKYVRKTVLINNNYLKLNPIYSNDGKIVNVDENDNRLTVLIPEKYRSEEKELRKYLEKEYYLQKYKVKNMFLKDIGEKTPLIENITLNIVWVKNNQSYFTFDMNLASDTDNRFYDGIGMVLTNANGNEAAWYDTVIGNVGYFMKLTDKKVPYNSIKHEIEYLGLQEYYPELINAYEEVGDRIQMYLEKTYQFLVILSVVLLVYLCISIFTTLIYLEQFKYKLTIQTIHGYSYFIKHRMYLILTNSIWIISIFISSFIGKFDFAGLIFFVSLLENMVIYLLIKKGERKKLIQIIKEG